MKYHQRREFLREIEQLARTNEAAYRRRVRGMMWRARTWLYGILLGSLGLAAAAIAAASSGWINGWIAFVLIALGLVVAWRMGRVMFFRLYPPVGFEIPRTSFPLLFKDVRELREKLDAPRFHDVVFTMEMGAAMVEVPSLFGLLPSRNFLIIGLPLLHGVSRDEFLAILAHELAHLSRKHNRLTRAVHRLRVQLARAGQELQRRLIRTDGGAASGLLDFWERFELATRYIARAHEFEADRISAQLATPQRAAVALCKAHVLGRYWQENLDDEIRRHMVHSDIPDLMPLQTFRKQLGAATAAKEFEKMLDRELRRKTSPEDTHPALGARLEAVGGRPAVEWVVPETAARSYFGRECDKVAGEFDKAWVSWIIPYWRARYDANRRARDYNGRLRAMEKRGEKLCLGELWSMAAIDERLQNLATAAAGYERFLALFPAALEAKLALGRVLRDSDALRAETLLREVVTSHPLLWVPARELLIDLLRDQGRIDEVDALESALDQAHGTGEEVFTERLEVRLRDTFKPAAMDKIVTDAIYNLAGQLGTVRKLWLVERKSEHFPEIRDFVLIFTPTSEARSQRLVEATQSILASEVYLPGTFVVVLGNLRHAFLRAKAAKIEGAEIFSKND